MNLKISKQTENKLLGRNEVKGEIEFSGATPSNDDVAKKIAEAVKSAPDLVVVKGVYTEFGKTAAKFDAVVYVNAESREETEKKTKHIKEKMKKAEEEAKQKAEEEKKAAEEAKKAEAEAKAADEKPAEEKPEEKPAEEKKE